MNRQKISARVRFDVFKRDGFVCHYCGAHPPDALLEVDHIEPVAAGGSNDVDNLITACQRCNRGKGAVPLSVVPQSLAEKAQEVREREAQIAGYREVMDARAGRIEADAWRALRLMFPTAATDGVRRDWLLSTKRFVERMPTHEVMQAAEIAFAKPINSDAQRFRYFCGVCWSKIKESADGPRN